MPATGWTSPSPCPEWSAADVVGHLIETQRNCLDTHGVDLGAAPDVAADPAAAWREHARQVREALSGDAGLTDEELDRIEAGADSFGPAL